MFYAFHVGFRRQSVWHVRCWGSHHTVSLWVQAHSSLLPVKGSALTNSSQHHVQRYVECCYTSWPESPIRKCILTSMFIIITATTLFRLFNGLFFRWNGSSFTCFKTEPLGISETWEFLQAVCPLYHPAKSVKALKKHTQSTEPNQWLGLIISLSTI